MRDLYCKGVECRHGLILPRVFASAVAAISVSCAAWARSQYPLDRPKNRQRRRSVSAVMVRRPATISPIRYAGTPISWPGGIA